VDVDRSKAELVGVTEQAVASNVLVSLSGSFQTNPSFWVDPKGGTQYQVIAQTPQYRLQNLNDLGNTPLNGARNSSQILSNLITIHRSAAPAVVSHYNATPSIDIYGSVQGADLGFVSAQIEKIVAQAKKDLPRGSNIVIRGQVQTMKASFSGLLIGLVGAVVLVYLLIVVNFQSFVDPFIIITALPAALAGIVWMLFLTNTTVSVPALMGAIMCMGVATANSVLVISFARERMDAGETAFEAALQAGYTRLRPVVMTATAMIIGMIPMALSLGEGGEQNAPLGRAVIGGLMFATVATLFFVPTVFSIIHGRRSMHPAHPVELSHG
jgi:multidrug efflux pump subunit AcrB